MKRVLFIGITEYNLHESRPGLHKKFEGLAADIDIFVVARGKPFYKNAYSSYFYLMPYRALYLPFAISVGAYLCITKKIDTLICQGPLTEGIVGVLLKFLFRKELIIEIHGDWREGPFINKKRFLGSFLRRVVPHVGAWTIKNADKIRTLTYIAQKELKDKFPRKKYFVFPTFTDIDIFLNEKDTVFKKYILTVAVLSPIKSTETLIDAFSRIRRQFPEFKLIIAGDGPSLENLKLKVKNKKLQEAVVFTGKLSLEGVRDVMRDCYVFVLPSLSEGFGRVLIEAMALSKPVIATKVGGVPEIVKDGENGFLIEPKDPDALAAKLKILINSPELTIKMGEAGRALVSENFSNAKYIQNYINMINA